jgi:DNA-binding transcriptional ArsR family regulator
MTEDLDKIWKALADETRRSILDMLRTGPRTTTEIVDQFPNLSRFAVMKHLDVLRQAALVLTREEGRRRINSLNAVPIRMIYERWVSHFENLWAGTLVRIKESAERSAKSASANPAPTKTARKKPANPPRKRRRRRRPPSNLTTSTT